MDFTIQIYHNFLESFRTKDISFQPFSNFIEKVNKSTIVLRHDVDLLPHNSLRFAKIQAELGIKGTYYFRAVPESWDEETIKEIAEMGHEIGYHYENLTTCKGDIEKAYEDFQKNLEALRKLATVSTICMHGSPSSPYDSKDIWKKYDYRSLGIIGEPYFDVDFSKALYLTDTGRRWDGYKVSVRDKIPVHQERWNKEGLSFHSTQDIINAANAGKLPDKIMFTFHPQRWHNKPLPWLKELIVQNAKNTVKRMLIGMRG
ncbi:MAG: hypothetical protein WCL51_05025 [Bacteroidota bacterium]